MFEVLPTEGVPAALSPSLRTERGSGPAFELKHQLPAAAAAEIEAWVRRHMTADPHGQDGRYHTTSIYCDTPRFDVFHRSAGYRRSKYRLRRYGTAARVFLERKTKRGDQVTKRRAAVTEAELPLLAAGTVETGWPALWFSQRVHARELRPVCRVGYERTAFVGHAAEGAIRVTFDRHLIGAPAAGWAVEPLHEGRELLPGEVLIELKFQAVLPDLFRQLLQLLPPHLARTSKFRRCVRAWELARGHEE